MPGKFTKDDCAVSGTTPVVPPASTGGHTLSEVYRYGGTTISGSVAGAAIGSIAGPAGVTCGAILGGVGGMAVAVMNARSAEAK
jgi:hypothetical protein